jgi:branched-chain amino acid transport system substrate-binding protein
MENRELGIFNGRRRDHFQFSILNFQFSILCLLLILIASLVLTGCNAESYTQTRPVVKIGLIAPFEGLYRESGYEALAAMRSAIADSPLADQAGVDLLPLALDDSADPDRSGRAAAKMLADPAVAAVVGPLFPSTGLAAATQLARAAPIWIPAFSVNPIHGYAKEEGSLATGTIKLVRRVADDCRAQGCVRLVLAGEATGWPTLTEAAWGEIAQLLVVIDSPPAQEIQAGDGVLWLGLPHAGADYLTELRHTQPEAPFWLASPFGMDVFARRADLSGPIFWAAWLTVEYEDWAADHTPNSPAAFQIYQATQAAITAALAPDSDSSPPGPAWTVTFFRLTPDGSVRQD